MRNSGRTGLVGLEMSDCQCCVASWESVLTLLQRMQLSAVCCRFLLCLWRASEVGDDWVW